MKIYNTMTREKEEFVPIVPGKAGIYACGPTVYNFIHVGNARPAIIFDVLRRYLEYCGIQVTFVQNFTDIDDKVIKRANEDGVHYSETAARFIAEYRMDADGLGIREASVHPKATENIDAIIEIVGKLIENGYAYESGGDVYYAAEKFGGYGKLSHQPLEELKPGGRVEPGELKRSAVDFALWKGTKPGEPSWPSPWGEGRPGWHIECSAMAGRYLGKTIDIHCGGQDLIFPHHENEIAQSEAANGCEFARYWMHNGFLSIDNRKMSKSLGNFFTVREAAEKYGYEPIRFFMLSAHYRSPLNYSVEALEQAKSALARLYTTVENLEFLSGRAEAKNADDAGRAFIDTLPGYVSRFVEAMEDDLNTADAVGVLFEMARAINTAAAANPSAELAEASLRRIEEICSVLGILYNRERKDLEAGIAERIEARQAARKEKNFAEADRIRDELLAEGIVLEDTPQGVKWRRREQ